MFPSATAADRTGASLERPTLDLSGPALARSFEILVRASEKQGGIEKLVDAVKLKSALFRDVLGGPDLEGLNEDSFKTLCAFMAPVRRRIGPRLEQDGFLSFRAAIAGLFLGAEDTATTDSRIQKFCKRFPQDRQHRWVRDLAAELLHYCYPETYPLMCRWVWDAQTNTGMLREIWHADNLDTTVIDVSDNYAAFLMLREELSQFLTDNGVFRDVLYYVDMLSAQSYAYYIASQGSTYLRADFNAEEDPLQYTRRLLGLDGIKSEKGRTRLKTVDGDAYVVDEPKFLGRSLG